MHSSLESNRAWIYLNDFLDIGSIPGAVNISDDSAKAKDSKVLMTLLAVGKFQEVNGDGMGVLREGSPVPKHYIGHPPDTIRGRKTFGHIREEAHGALGVGEDLETCFAILN